MMLPVDHVYVLNLDRRPDKWERMQVQLKKLGISAERFSAVDGSTPEFQAKHRARYDRTLIRLPGAMGCLLSHLAILQDAKAKGYRRIAVFEDDVLFAKDFDASLLSRLPDQRWHAVYLGASQLEWDTVKFKQCGPLTYYHPTKTLGTFALLFDAAIYDTLIEAYTTRNEPVDCILRDILTDDQKAIVLSPNLVIADVTCSDIRVRISQQEYANKCRWKLGQYEPRIRLDGWLNEVTFGITHFDRPRHLERCLNSIRFHYPKARILVADNSKLERPVLPEGVGYLELPPDCGAAACRNALGRNCPTKYLLQLEEDFLFTPETNIARLHDVLALEPSVGVIAGSMWQHQLLIHHQKDLTAEDDGWLLSETKSPYGYTADTSWRQVDMPLDFYLARREVYNDVAWDERITIGGEHAQWFIDIKEHGKWAVAHTPQVRVFHDTEERSPHYLTHRRRPRAEAAPKLTIEDLAFTSRRPNIIVFGVGHSGTTILTKVLVQLGWKCPNRDEEYYEEVDVRKANQDLLAGSRLVNVGKILWSLEQPWVIKDPRLVVTLSTWMPTFTMMGRRNGNYPLLLGIVRDVKEVEASHTRRGESLLKSHGGYSVADLRKLYREQFDAWPWAKLEVRYEDLAAAAALFRR